jgi:hypothetical protein
MFATETSKASHTSGGKTISRLFFLEASEGRILSVNPDGSDKKVIVTGSGPIPDGIVVDVEAGHIYWTNMGIPNQSEGRSRREESQDDCSQRRNIHAQAAPSR